MTREAKSKPMPGPKDITAVLKFLPIFESPKFTFCEHNKSERCDDGAFTMPYVVLTEQASKFVHALYEHGFIRPFKWTEWQAEAQRYVEDPAALEQADMGTICKLFTTHVRKDRFCDGHLNDMYERGHLTALLRRLGSLPS